MQNLIEYIIFLILAGFIRFIGLKTARRLSLIIAFIFYYIIPIRKKVTISNLQKAFPEYSKSEIRKIAFESYKSFSITLVEVLFIPFMTQEEIENSLICKESELDLIKDCYNRKNGLILLSGHFGNWEYIALAVSLKVNIPFHVVVKSQRNPYVDAYLNKGRTKWINKVIPLGVSVRKTYAELKSKNIVAMVADQRGPEEGMRINFLNQSTALYQGPALLALKTNAPIIYGLTIRQANYKYITYITEINLENLPDDEERRIQEVSQRHMAFLESFIRKHPEQWLWMHNIWKY
jgi:KDO2-lipid IV(A) lauroyltransferase